MPTMTNPETGETKEISMEEFLKIMRSGQGSLQQVVTHADGSTSATTLYGNVSDDGLDRSVNIFVDKDTFNAFIIRKIKKLTGEIEDPASEKDPEELFEMTVDFTDSAVMGILKATKDELLINLYTRDERKATFDHLRQGSKSWKINPDHSISFNGADLQGEDKTISLYMLAFLEMRQFLRASGNLAELKRLGNRGTGVVIKASDQADDAKATIVRGRNRPDLPCSMLLLGEQMMRPYMDEMMSDMMMSGMSIEEKIKEAENGDPDCMESLAQAYLNGDGVEQDFKKSAYWWEKFAGTDNSVAQFNIGLYYAKGCGVTRDFAKAAEWMKKAADNGDEDAPAPYEMYSKASENLKKAENGDAAAQAEMAKLYTQIGGSLDQFGSGRDYQEAFKWAKKSADQGNLEGMYCLALCYEHGRGTSMSASKAVSTYEKAAKQGHAPSQWNLAVCYLNGNGVQRDETKGYSWAYQAADQGNELAINGLEAQGKTVKQIIERCSDPEYNVALEGTQYEGRADRCERIRVGMELQYKIIKDKNGEDALECFYNGGSVGLISRWEVGDVIALLRLERVTLKIKVKSCIPKSKRGARARNADVHLTLSLTERKPETPEERAARLKAEEDSRRKAEEERRRKEEQRQRAEAEAKAAEEAKKQREAEEKKAYKKTLSEWEQAIEKVKTARKNELSRRRKAQMEALNKKNKDEYEAAIAAAEQANAVAEEKKKQAEETRASLGVFKFTEKKEQNALIAEAEAEITEARKTKEAAQKKYTEAIADMDAVLDRYVADQSPAVEKAYPMPAEPEKPEVILEEERIAEEKRIKEACNELLGAFRSRFGNYDTKQIVNLLCEMEENKWYRQDYSFLSIHVGSQSYDPKYFSKLHDLQLVDYKMDQDDTFTRHNNYKLSEKGIRLKQDILSLGIRRKTVLGV